MSQLIAVWFSCGAASAVAAKLALEKYSSVADVHIVNNPVVTEDADNIRFLKDVEQWLNVEIEQAVNPKYPSGSCEAVWKDRQFMSGVQGAPCTLELKKRARQLWEEKHKPDWHVLGFTIDEQKRSDTFALTERENLLPVLIKAGLTKQDCMDIVTAAGIALPRMYRLGYPNANCPGCVKATSPTYWNKVRETHPEVFKSRAEQSRKYGARLVRVKGERIYLDELSPDAKGRPLKEYSVDCGIFCEEQL